MRPHIIVAMALLAMLALCIVPPSVSAVSTDLQRVSAPGVDLWASQYSQVEYSEIVLLINYQDVPVVLQIRNATGTVVTTYTLAPQSSDVYELVYPDLGHYIVAVGSLTYPIIELPRERPAMYLPPPRDADWTWTRPAPEEKYTWTDAMVDDLVASLTLINIMWAAVIVSIGLAIGAGVKAFTRFLAPTDFISLGLVAAIVIEVIFQPFGQWDRLWYIVWVIGYFCGFFLWHVDYILPVMTDCTNRTIDVRPVTVYLPDDGSGYCIQVQRNKDLIKRIMGIPHRLGTDAGLPNDWIGRFKRPYFPAVKGRLTWVQKTEIKIETVKLWRWNVKRYTTTYRVAHASGVDKVQWLNEAKWYFRLQDMFDKMAVKYNDLLLGHRAESTATSAAMVEHATSVSPARRVNKWFRKDMGDIDLETGENSYSEIEDVSTRPQEGIADDEADEVVANSQGKRKKTKVNDENEDMEE